MINVQEVMSTYNIKLPLCVIMINFHLHAAELPEIMTD